MFYRFNQCKAIYECLALGSIKKDKEIFDIKCFISLNQWRSILERLALKFSVNK